MASGDQLLVCGYEPSSQQDFFATRHRTDDRLRNVTWESICKHCFYCECYLTNLEMVLFSYFYYTGHVGMTRHALQLGKCVFFL